MVRNVKTDEFVIYKEKEDFRMLCPREAFCNDSDTTDHLAIGDFLPKTVVKMMNWVYSKVLSEY